jgi:hypothetical protein
VLITVPEQSAMEARVMEIIHNMLKTGSQHVMECDEADTCEVGGKPLVLNGVGIRKVFLIEVYRAFLYTVSPVRSRREITLDTSPCRLEFQFSYGQININTMRKAWKDAFANSIGHDAMEAERSAFAQFLDTVSGYRKGDVVRYDIANGEVAVHANGQYLGTICSKVLCEAIIDVVAGEKPIDEYLKKGLLNLQ